MLFYCQTCWRPSAQPTLVARETGECWTCRDQREALWRAAYFRPECVPGWMRVIARPWEAAA